MARLPRGAGGRLGVALAGGGVEQADAVLAAPEDGAHDPLAGRPVEGGPGGVEGAAGEELRADLVDGDELALLALREVDGAVAVDLLGGEAGRADVGLEPGRVGRGCRGGRRGGGVAFDRRHRGGRGRIDGGRGGRIGDDARVEGGEHRPELELGGLADQGDGPVLVLHAGDLDEDVVALAGDLRLGHAEGVDALADDGDGLVDGVAVGLALGLQHDRHTALEVEAQQRLVARRRGCR